MLKLSTIALTHINVLEKELEVLKTRKKDERRYMSNAAFYDVVEYFERRIEELNKSDD